MAPSHMATILSIDACWCARVDENGDIKLGRYISDIVKFLTWRANVINFPFPYFPNNMDEDFMWILLWFPRNVFTSKKLGFTEIPSNKI